jgi:N-dimethylarginine dimethylaminohydrolase
MPVSKANILGQLEELARSLGIEIRNETLRKESSFSPGGLCRFKGDYLMIFNSKATKEDRIEALAQALTRFDLDQVYLRPGLREFLEKYSKKKESEGL